MTEQAEPQPEEVSLQAIASKNALTPLGALGVLLLGGVLTATNGAWGFLAGGLVLAAAAASGGPAAFALAQLAVVALLPAEVTLTLAATQVAAFFLLANALGWPPTRRRFGELAVAYLLVFGFVWLLQANLRWVWQSALVLVVAATAVSYGLYRYEQVTLGLVTAEVEE